MRAVTRKRDSAAGVRAPDRSGLRRAAPAIGLSLACAAAAFLLSASVVTERFNPALATALWPGNDGAWAKRAAIELATVKGLDKVLVGRVSSQGTPAPYRLRFFAAKALRSSALEESALRTLAYASLIEADEKRASSLLRAANATSRRDIASHILLAREALLAKNLDRALAHFDLALRVNFAIRDQIFPMMAQALAYPDFQRSFAPFIKRDNLWISEFLRFSVEKGLNPQAIGEIIAVSAGALPPLPGSDIREIAPVYLVSNGEIRLARQIASQLPPAQRPAKGGGVSEGSFRDTNVAEPFGWTFTSSSQVSVLPPGGQAETLTISSSMAYSGELARQLLTLPPGRYRLRATGELGSNTSWQLTCTPGSQALAPAGRSGGDFVFEVPKTQCEGQWLRLEARAIGPLEVNLREVRIDPFRG